MRYLFGRIRDAVEGVLELDAPEGLDADERADRQRLADELQAAIETAIAPKDGHCALCGAIPGSHVHDCPALGKAGVP